MGKQVKCQIPSLILALQGSKNEVGLIFFKVVSKSSFCDNIYKKRKVCYICYVLFPGNRSKVTFLIYASIGFDL